MALSCVVQAHAKEDDSLFTKAEDLVNNGNYLDAVSIYREISISSDKPDTRARALLFIGSIYANDLDQLDAAITCYKDLIRSYPHSSSAPDALFCCGQIYYKNNKYSDAKKTFENYIRMYPKGIRLKSAMAWATDSEKKISDSPEKPAISKNLAPLSPYVRVLIVKNEKTIVLTATSKISVKDAKSGSLLYTGQGPVNFTKSGKKIIINTRAVSSAGCSVTSENCCVSVNGCRYRGSMNIHNKPSGLIAVNHVDIESYLYGVIPKEMPCIWSPDALMAQAVASRTYALYI
ncbi:MAG: tetratricopeptide repeat protein, partial [Desulfobacteraceae bacterium]|nr:tetratricopeptide repeat protein [Desulfobacteraceae bacterium]